MFDLIMDFVVEPFANLVLCRFNLKRWGRYTGIHFLLGIATLIPAVILALGWNFGNWFCIIAGLAGMGYFGYMDVKYTLWWIREGRFGAESSFGDDVAIPKGDLMSGLSEEELLRSKASDIKKT